MLALATDTPDFMRARNATDILSQVGRHTPRLPRVATAERSRAAFCPLDQVQAQCRDGQSHLHHRDRHPRHPPRSADEEHRQSGRSTPPPKQLETSSSGRFFTLCAPVQQKRYKEDAEKTMSHYVPVLDTPEMQRVRENQKNFSTVSNDRQWGGVSVRLLV